MKHFPGPWFRVVTSIFQNPLALATGVLLCLSPIAARGQSVTFAGTQTTLPASNLHSPAGAAIDSVGDVFITDTVNSRVVELPPDSDGVRTAGDFAVHRFEIPHRDYGGQRGGFVHHRPGN